MSLTVGILGGGQLARMLIQAGRPLGLDFLVYTDTDTAATRHITERLIAHLDDQQSLDNWVGRCDRLTFETENIPTATLDYLTQYAKCHPHTDCIRATQDRLLEKKLFNTLGIPTTSYMALDATSDLFQVAEQLHFPFIIKSRRNGYDGKNQHLIKDAKAIEHFMKNETLNDTIAEAFVHFKREVSLIAVSNSKQEYRYYDISENRHHDGILRETENRPNDTLHQHAIRYTEKLLRHFNYVGTIALEFFVDHNELLIANEIAPRVHNSGHWTIEGAVTSQFENHLRAICDLPLGNCQSTHRCLMTNIISTWPNREALFKTNNLKIHDYCKSERPNRKIGHVNQLKLDSVAKI